MAGKKKAVEKIITIQTATPVLVWKATSPLTEQQHEELSRKLRHEQEHTGIEMVLIPHSVDANLFFEMRESTSESEPPDHDVDKEEQTEPEGQKQSGEGNE